ncbi:MAG: hypothetical protein IJV06_09355 [Bacteroidaceae bacterium]|nr:hypothetical protein [Bacteroidaceae bacterium]
MARKNTQKAKKMPKTFAGNKKKPTFAPANAKRAVLDCMMHGHWDMV